MFSSPSDIVQKFVEIQIILHIKIVWKTCKYLYFKMLTPNIITMLKMF